MHKDFMVRPFTTGMTLVKYDKLPTEAAKARARAGVLYIERQALENNWWAYKRRINENLHGCINQKMFFMSIKRKLGHFKKLEQNQKILEQHIVGNFCDFEPNGCYITYYFKQEVIYA